jgi:hypothetical protein
LVAGNNDVIDGWELHLNIGEAGKSEHNNSLRIWHMEKEVVAMTFYQIVF